MGAVQDIAATVEEEGGPSLIGSCVPPETTRLELVRAFTKYARAHREDLDLRVTALVIPALSEAFPCPQRRAASKFREGFSASLLRLGSFDHPGPVSSKRLYAAAMRRSTPWASDLAGAALSLGTCRGGTVPFSVLGMDVRAVRFLIEHGVYHRLNCPISGRKWDSPVDYLLVGSSPSEPAQRMRCLL